MFGMLKRKFHTLREGSDCYTKMTYHMCVSCVALQICFLKQHIDEFKYIEDLIDSKEGESVTEETNARKRQRDALLSYCLQIIRTLG